MNKVGEATRIRSILSLRGLPDLAKAACKDSDPELFFPPPGGRGSGAQAEAAKRICLECIESGACLDWALSDTQIDGIWGGTTDAERRELRRAQRNRQ